MSLDNYLEEAMKMRNLLEEFRGNHGLRRPTILGVREHVFTGSVSSLAWFMSNQETSFVTLGQRVLANPLKEGDKETWKRHSIFRTRCISKGKLCIVVIDGGSTDNLVSQEIVDKLGLQTTKHPKPFSIQWFKKEDPVVVNHQCLVPLTIGPYEDTVMCTVVPMDICHLLLGRLWQFDHRSIHDGAKNTHSFLHNDRKLILEPLKPPDIETTMCTTFLAEARESEPKLLKTEKMAGLDLFGLVFRVRMHYGHPDVFDRIFHITRGGISKASRVINISEDIYAGFNSTLRQGNITHHEYIQVGKGRDVGLNQIALFEGKVAGGNGEQVLSRDVYRLGQLFDFFRMLSFFFTTVGYYVCTMMTVLTVYIFLYGRIYLAFSGLDRGISRQAKILGNSALNAALNAQFLVQIGVFTAVPMIMGFILELGLLKAVFSFITMQLQLCSVFFTFSLGTRTHYFGRTILHGGAKYKATGRGFVVRHIRFAENYRLYSRSHFVKALEVALLLIVYIAYGYTEGGATSFILLTISSWFLVISWLFAPYIFNPSGFEWQKTVEDFDNWTSWLLYKGGVGVKGEHSWESWWDEEQMHIQTLRGRVLETLLSIRFFIFQYGIVYKLHLTGKDTSLAIYGFSWVALVAIVMIFKIFTFSPKKSTNFQLVLRFIQGVTSLGLLAALCLLVYFTKLSIPDLFASFLAFIATGWGILCLAITWKRVVRSLGLWDSVREFARLYDAGMGMLIFAPVAVLSWFPFVSTFQSRLLFNQAFSRGLEISLILAGNKANIQD
ncbi:hypothetical protein IFM89_013188 [Coptis chinensis]|uniref:Glycosyl transferase 48 domain-containing protein n=1 Tax=Coptis chinensis TaxID=261450 RepID=A0A835HVL4_9MAGN|nr:hypothetical protein IFM89_013188 [Coptis chinensis]